MFVYQGSVGGVQRAVARLPDRLQDTGETEQQPGQEQYDWPQRPQPNVCEHRASPRREDYEPRPPDTASLRRKPWDAGRERPPESLEREGRSAGRNINPPGTVTRFAAEHRIESLNRASH